VHYSRLDPDVRRCVHPYDDCVTPVAAASSSPLAPHPVEWLLLLTVLLGIACTVTAVRLASKGTMRSSGAIAVFLLNFVPIAGPVAAALGMAWGYKRRAA
jgi:hypothetical protein